MRNTVLYLLSKLMSAPGIVLLIILALATYYYNITPVFNMLDKRIEIKLLSFLLWMAIFLPFTPAVILMFLLPKCEYPVAALCLVTMGIQHGALTDEAHRLGFSQAVKLMKKRCGYGYLDLCNGNAVGRRTHGMMSGDQADTYSYVLTRVGSLSFTFQVFYGSMYGDGQVLLTAAKVDEHLRSDR